MPEFLKRLFRVSPLTLTFLIIVIGIAAYLSHLSFLDLVELKTVDLRFKFRGERPVGPEVVIAAIDEQSLKEQGKWIWPRAKLARMITNLSNAGASVVALDIGFLEPDPNNTASAVAAAEALVKGSGAVAPAVEAGLARLKAAGDNDQILADAIRGSKAKVVLGYFFQMDRRELGRLNKSEIDAQVENARSSRFQQIHETKEGRKFTGLRTAVMPTANIRKIAETTDYSGYFNMVPDKDGTVRWMPLVIRCEGFFHAPLALMAVRAFRHDELSLDVEDYGVSKLMAGKEAVPVNESGHLLINYRGGKGSFPYISVTDIIENRVPKERLAGKIVLVGATAVGIFDLRVTPFSEIYPGLEIHANVVDNILHKDFLWRPNWATLFDLLALVILAGLVGFFVPRWSFFPGALLTLGLFGFYLLLCQFLFSREGLLLNLLYPSSAILMTYVAMTAYKYVTEEAQKRFIRGAFSTYLSPSVVSEIIKNPEKLALGGEEREITAFFSDVQGFTSISERLSAHDLVALLNEFLTEMSNVILEEKGTVDKYEVDAIIAFFGAPNDLPDHAARACVACVKMQKRLKELRRKLKAEGRPELHMRIGLNTGRAVVGNMGSAMRMDYTMMGDTVNTAARLEGVNKVYGTYVMISESTYRDASHVIAVRELDKVMVVGKGEPVAVYEVLGLPGEVAPAQTEANRHYAKGLAAYRARKWDEASAHFKDALAALPEDGASLTMFQRCETYKNSPPPPNWNGAHVMKSK